jgi:ubiquinone/menaquinone biosynthesis C-methylase UbiE
VTGITITPREVTVATNQAKTRQMKDAARFELGDFEKMAFADESFDRVFTYETLFHARDVKKAVAELYRVLKPGGRAVFVEYEWDYEKFTPKYKKTYDFVRKYWGGYGVDQFGRGVFVKELKRAGFSKITEYDITAEVLPSMRRIKRWTAPLRALFGWNEKIAKHLPNNAGGNFYADAVDLGAFWYKIYVCEREAK